MTKTMLISAVLMTALAFTACKKNTMHPGSGNMMTDLASAGHMVTVNSSDYERVEAEALKRPDENSPYTEGVIAYLEDGNVTASIDFSKSGKDKAKCVDKDGEKEIELSDGKAKGKDKGSKYKKVVVEPIVKAEDCGYIVAGIIKFFDAKKGYWLATFDYGDGTCDDIITKTTKDGVYPFSMDDYPEWN